MSLHPQHQVSSPAVLQNERQVVRQAGRHAILQFLEQHNCFSVLRVSGKVVVFDTRIPIQLAFYALVEHGAYLFSFILRGNILMSFAQLFSCSTTVLLSFISPSRYACCSSVGRC